MSGPRDLGAGLRATPAARRIGVAVTGSVGWMLVAALYLVSVVQIGLLLRRIGDDGWVTAVLYPLPLLASAVSIAWSWVPDRVGLVR